MSGPGKRAALPPSTWKSPSRRSGTTVFFVSEDGTQRMSIDLSSLPVTQEIRLEIAVAVEAATGPMGQWKRLATAKNIPRIAKLVASWISDARPELNTLRDFTPADGRMLARSITNSRSLGSVRTLLSNCEEISPQVLDEFARHHIPKIDTAREPYTDAEYERICVAARGVVRRAKKRIVENRKLIADLRDGKLDHLEEDDEDRKLAVVLDYCDQYGDLPRSPVTGAPNTLARRQSARFGRGRENLMNQIHLKSEEAWAFGVLLAALAGFNASVISSLPARHLLASRSDEQPIALVETNKPRRGANAKTTLPLAHGDSDKPSMSLATPIGVYSTLIFLTEPTRSALGVDSAIVYFTGIRDRETGSKFRTGLPEHCGRAATWLAPWKTGDRALDRVLDTVSMDRLRKTRIEKSRFPINHSPSVHDHYLKRMRKVREEGFEIVREALNEQVTKAIASRRMIVDPGSEAAPSSKDTVLGECNDFDHSPFDNGGSCRQSFLTCLNCVNARAFPRHLPLQLLVAEQLRELQKDLPAETWIRRYAGSVAQIEDILNAYTTGQIEQARMTIDENHRRLVAGLLQGNLDAI